MRWVHGCVREGLGWVKRELWGPKGHIITHNPVYSSSCLRGGGGVGGVGVRGGGG